MSTTRPLRRKSSVCIHTVIHRRADVVPHGRDFNIVAAVGTFDGGQKAHLHGRHPESITVAGTARSSLRVRLRAPAQT